MIVAGSPDTAGLSVVRLVLLPDHKAVIVVIDGLDEAVAG